jgi:phosphoribosylcarboxyaminoimidazole (NCAIR) mutase
MPDTATFPPDLEYPVLPQSDTDTDWLSVARRIQGLHEPAYNNAESALTDTYRVNRLLRHLADGNYVETAVRAAGISKQTFYNWKEQAKQGNVAAIALMDAVEKAQAEAESGIVADVRKAARKEQFWAAGITLLERTRPERFGKRSDENSVPKIVVQVGGQSTDVQVVIGVSGSTPETNQIVFAPTTDNPVIQSPIEAKVARDCKSLQPHAFAEPSSPVMSVRLTNEHNDLQGSTPPRLSARQRAKVRQQKQRAKAQAKYRKARRQRADRLAESLGNPAHGSPEGAG